MNIVCITKKLAKGGVRFIIVRRYILTCQVGDQLICFHTVLGICHLEQAQHGVFHIHRHIPLQVEDIIIGYGAVPFLVGKAQSVALPLWNRCTVEVSHLERRRWDAESTSRAKHRERQTKTNGVAGSRLGEIM